MCIGGGGSKQQPAAQAPAPQWGWWQIPEEQDVNKDKYRLNKKSLSDPKKTSQGTKNLQIPLRGKGSGNAARALTGIK